MSHYLNVRRFFLSGAVLEEGLLKGTRSMWKPMRRADAMSRIRCHVILGSVFAWVITGCIVFNSAMAQANAFPQWYEDSVMAEKARIKQVVEHIKGSFLNAMSEEERLIAKQVVVRVTDDFVVSHAGRGSAGRMLAYISVHDVMAVQQLFASRLLKELGGRFESLGGYPEYLVNRLIDNMRGEARRRPSIQEFLGLSRGEIEDLIRGQSDGIQEVSVQVGRMGGLAVMFLYAHEISHHVLKHFDKDHPATTLEKEAQADSWAVSLILRAAPEGSDQRLNHLRLTGIVPMFMLASQLEARAPQIYNVNKTHPHGSARLQRLLVEISTGMLVNMPGPPAQRGVVRKNWMALASIYALLFDLEVGARAPRTSGGLCGFVEGLSFLNAERRMQIKWEKIHEDRNGAEYRTPFSTLSRERECLLWEYKDNRRFNGKIEYNCEIYKGGNSHRAEIFFINIINSLRSCSGVTDSDVEVRHSKRIGRYLLHFELKNEISGDVEKVEYTTKEGVKRYFVGMRFGAN